MYRIIGADGREYGPATGSQLRQWIAEGRANAQTPALAPGAAEWKPLGALPDFAGQFAPPTPPPISSWPGMAGPARQTNGFAVAGLIFGLVGWALFCCCCGFPFHLLGLIFSLVGWWQINRNPGLYRGRGLAIAGLLLSAAGLLLGAGLVLFNLITHPENFEWHFKTF